MKEQISFLDALANIKHSSLRFNGADYIPDRDNPRLGPQLIRVMECMADKAWHTLEHISEITGDPAASVSAQLRHLRKKRFGYHTVERKHVGRGLYYYRILTLNKTW